MYKNVYYHYSLLYIVYHLTQHLLDIPQYFTAA